MSQSVPEPPDQTKKIDVPAEPSFASGRYLVRRLLGEGGQKTVFLAHDSQLDRDVAVALLKTDGLDTLGIARVQREAQAMARLGAQPHIVAIYDIGEHEGRPFTICEYMAGGDLQRALRGAGGPFSIERALSIAKDLARALAVAHRHGILHRDIKPANVWLTEEGAAKLGDFGLAISLDRSRVTQPGTIMGTAAYMAPEQALGGEVDDRSDLYSLGCVLYEMMTGRPPFLGDDTIAIVSQHINTAPVAPSWHQRNIPQALERLTLRLLAKAPDQRPKSAAEVEAALEAIAGGPQEAAAREDANPLDRLAGGVFVGREQELGELRSSLDDALSGRGRLVLLAGEPGIGKTRLAEELATYAQVRGAQVLWGRCYEGEGAPAYWPWVQAIRSYVYERPADTLLSELGTGAADIAQIVSEVRERLPGLPQPPAMEPEQARFRLFDSITTFLKNAARAQPLVLMLDDLHWADKPSLLLLQFLARELRDARFLVLGGYRDVELGRQHPLSHTLAELTREQLSQRVVLRGLSELDVARFIEMTAGIDPPAGLVTTVFKETEGNPFFVKEVVTLLATERRLERGDTSSWTIAIPESVREVVGRRLDHLSEACNQALTIASVIGREFSLVVLERVYDLTGDQLLDTVEEAVAARVVQEMPRGAGRCRFSHALIRETLYEELTTTRRVRLHRRVAEALEALYGAKPGAHLAELAYHFCEAARSGGDVDKAIEYARRAGARAMSVYAWEEAAGHYQNAMEALDLKVEPDEAMRCELLLALAETEWNAGDFEKSREDSLRAATVAKEHGAPEQLARAAVGYGGSAAADGTGLTDQVWISMLQEVLDTLEEGHDALRAQAMTKLAEAQIFSGPYDERAALCQRALELARKANDPIVLGDVLATIHWTLWSPDNVNERLDMANEIQRLAEETGSASMAAVATQWRSIDLVELGDVRVAKQNLEIIAPRVQEARMAYDLWAVRVYQATLLISEGRLEEGERAAGRALEIGQRRQNPNALALFGVQLLLLRREQGRFQELEPVMSTYVEQYPAIPAWRCGLAWLYSNIGQEPEARAEFERLAVDEFARLPRDMFWVTGLALLADVCGYLRDAPRAGILYDLLAPYADRCAIPIAVIFGAVARSLGVLATTMQRWEDAVRHFENAIEMNERLGSPPWVAHTRYDYAKMLLERGEPGDRDKALALLNEALTTAHELGMRAVEERADALMESCHS